jgi:polyhydroxybutyrate depolymerase
MVLQVDGTERSYLLEAPGRFAVARPLIIALHGWLGSGSAIEEMSRLSEAAYRQGLVVAYPDGVWRSWGVSPTEPKWVADAAFLKAVVRDVSARVRIDPRRVYLVGFSAGGFMAQALACTGEMPVAGLAVVSSNLFAEAAEACGHPPAVPFLLVHGTADPMVPYQGGSTARGQMLSIPDTMAYWARANGCAGPLAELSQASADPGVAVVREVATRCAAGGAAEAWLLEGGGHDWPGTTAWLPSFIVGQRSDAVDATRVVLDFLLRPNTGL